MFETWSEKARRSIFFARWEASNVESPEIRPIDLLAGLIKEDTVLFWNTMTQSENKHEQLRLFQENMREHLKNDGVKFPCSSATWIPLSQASKKILEEAGRIGGEAVQTRHLLL